MAQPGSEHIVKITSEVVYQDDGTTAYRTKVMGELVRCKDCVHYYTNAEIGYPNCELLKGRFIVKDEWFCADGERKEKNDE